MEYNRLMHLCYFDNIDLGCKILTINLVLDEKDKEMHSFLTTCLIMSCQYNWIYFIQSLLSSKMLGAGTKCATELKLQVQVSNCKAMTNLT